MNVNNNYLIHGVVQGVQYGQNERVDELNNRISSRYFPDVPLEPNYNMRPVPTKYSLFPIVNNRTEVREPRLNYVDYNPYLNFNPSNAKSNVKGFQSNVDTETILRNQTFALQHGAEQSVYVPTSNSDLYNVSVSVSNPVEQTHPLLFAKMEHSNKPHQNLLSNNIGNNTFFNHTRTQLRNM
jgi:hypothetical protein